MIEMVIAFAILAMMLTALYTGFESALSRSRHDARFSEATLLAESLLARAGADLPLGPGTQNGEWNEFTYELAEQIAPATAGSPAPTIPTIRLSASVTWVEASGKRSLAISTLKPLPPAAP